MFLCKIISKRLCILLILNHVSSLPIQPHRDAERDPDQTDENDFEHDVVYVPYDIKYVPVEISINSDTSTAKLSKHAFIKNTSDDIQNSFENNEEKVKPIGLNTNHNAEDLVLVPVSSVKRNDNEDIANSSEEENIKHENHKQNTKEKELILVPLSALAHQKNNAFDTSVEKVKELPDDLILVPASKLENKNNSSEEASEDVVLVHIPSLEKSRSK